MTGGKRSLEHIKLLKVEYENLDGKVAMGL